MPFHPASLRGRLRTLAATAAATTLAATIPATASAVGTYAVQACTAGDLYGIPVADAFGGWAGDVSTADPTHHVEDDCASSLGMLMQLKGTDRKAAGDYAGWKFTAPSNTKVTDAVLTYDAYTRPTDGQTQGAFKVTAGGAAAPLTTLQGAGMLEDRVAEYHDLSGRWLKAAVICASSNGSDCPNGEDGTAMIHAAVVTLADDLEPMVPSASGSVLTDQTWQGDEDLTYTASDLGGGVATFMLRVDGDGVLTDVPDTNGGACVPVTMQGGVPVFRAPRPCTQSVTASETVDTTAIDDGAHQVDLVVADASGRETVIASGTKVVANHPPVNDAAPAFVDGGVAGQPHVGDTLEATEGSWSGPDLTYAVAWERCEADGSGCAQIPGATIDSYVPTNADVGKRLRMAVTATNPAASETGRTPMTGTVSAMALSPGGGGGTGTGDTGGTGGQAGATAGDAPALDGTGSGEDAPHVLVGHVAGEPPSATCPQDRAALLLQGVRGHTLKLRHGRVGRAHVVLTCAANGKPIAGARLDVATRTGSAAAVASQMTTDASGHAALRLAAGPSRAVTIGYRMYADDPLARATVTLRVRVAGRVALRVSRRVLRNGQAVTLTGMLLGGHVPRRGVDLAVQWRDGRRWRPFAQVRTSRRGRFHYAYRFTRTRRTVRYALRVQVLKGQVDYPFAPVASRAVRVVVRP